MINTLKSIAHIPIHPDGFDPIEKFAKHYMFVDVIIKNNSPYAIFLKKDRYLKNSEFFVAPKRHLSALYTNAVAGLPTLAVAVFGVLGICGGSQAFEAFQKGIANNWQGSEALSFGGWGSLTALSCIATGLGIKVILEWRAKLTTTLLQTAKLSKGAKKRRYKADTTTYKVPAGSTFYDRLLIDLKEASRTFLESDPTSLLYQEVTA